MWLRGAMGFVAGLTEVGSGLFCQSAPETLADELLRLSGESGSAVWTAESCASSVCARAGRAMRLKANNGRE